MIVRKRRTKYGGDKRHRQKIAQYICQFKKNSDCFDGGFNERETNAFHQFYFNTHGETQSPENIMLRNEIKDYANVVLGVTERKILKLWLSDFTLREIGSRTGYSAEWVRCILNKAVRKIIQYANSGKRFVS